MSGTATGSQRRAVARGLLIVGVATMVGNSAAFALSMVAARVLTPAEFGAFGALLGLSIIVSTLAIAVQAVAARRVAVAAPGEAREAAEGETVRLAALLAVGVVVGSLLLAWPLSGPLDIPALALALGLAGTGFIVMGFVALGIAQGREDHGRVAGAFLANGVVRALLGMVGVVALGTLLGAAAGILVGCLLGAAAAYWLVRPARWAPRLGPGLAVEYAHTAHALIVLYALTNVDVLLARIYLTPDESGAYSVGVLLAKIAFFLPTAVVVVLFPRMAAGGSRRPLMYAAGLTAAVGVAITGFSYLFGSLVIRVLGGTQYPDLGSLAWLFALEGSAFALVQVLLYSRLADEDRRAVALVWGALIALVAIVALWRHDSVVEIVTTVVAVSLVPTVIALILDWRRRDGDEAPLPLELAE